MTGPELTQEQAEGISPESVLGAWAAADFANRQARWRVSPGQSVQRVLNAAIRDARTTDSAERIVIALDPGHYEGPVIVPDLHVGGRAVPVSILGVGARHTTLAAATHIRMTGSEYRTRYGASFANSPPEVRALFDALAASNTIGNTHCAVLTACSAGFEASGFAIENRYNCDRTTGAPLEPGAIRNAAGQWSDETHQAFALTLHGAQSRLRNIALKSFQDTLYLAGGAEGAHLTGCIIEGDVDFIFGPATAVFERCEIRSRGSRSANSWATAPSTPLDRPYGFVFINCDFTHDDSPNARAGRFRLGRQWFCGVRATPYGAPTVPGYTCRLGDTSAYDPPHGTISPETLLAVGKCLILHSRVGAHIDPQHPWDDWKGGQYAPDGIFRPVRWNARYRPVQYDLSDVTRYLAGWPDLPTLNLTGQAPGPFLAIYETAFARNDTVLAAQLPVQDQHSRNHHA